MENSKNYSQEVYDHLLRNQPKSPQKPPILNKWDLLVGKIYFSVVTFIFVSHHMYGTMLLYVIPGLIIIYLSEWKWKS